MAVIMIQYTSPGAKPTIRGIHTGHPSAAVAMFFSPKVILFKSILPFEVQNRTNLKKCLMD